MNQWISLAGFVLSMAIAVISVTVVIVQMRTNVDRLTKHEESQELREERAARELTELLVLLKTFTAEQTQINKTVEAALSGVIDELKQMERRTVESSTVVSLLSEMLKRAEVRGLTIQP